MKKRIRLLLGVASLWLPVYLLLFMGVAFYSMFTRGAEPPAIWAVIIPLHLLTMLLTIGLMIFYIVNVFRNDRVTKDMKVLWAVVLFMGAMIAMPVYWYLYIWRDVAYPPPLHPPGTLGPGTTSIEDSSKLGTIRTNEYVPPLQPPDWR
jgi:hypothetical protein